MAAPAQVGVGFKELLGPALQGGLGKHLEDRLSTNRPQPRPRAPAKPAPLKGFSYHRHCLERVRSTHYERDQTLQDFTQHQCYLYLESH